MLQLTEAPFHAVILDVCTYTFEVSGEYFLFLGINVISPLP